MSALLDTARLLTIDLDILKDARLLTLQGEEALNEEYQFFVDVFSPTVIATSALIEQTVSIRISASANNTVRFIHGVITQAQSQLDAPHQHHHYRLRIEPQFKLLSHTSDCRLFHFQSATDIITTLLAEHGIRDCNIALLQRTYPVLDHVSQYNESAYAFLKRLMAEAGICYYYQHSAERHTLTLIDSSNQLAPLATAVHLTRPLHHQNLQSLLESHSVATEKLSNLDYNYNNSNEKIAATIENINKIKPVLKQSLETFQHPGETETAQAQQQLKQQQQYLEQQNTLQQGKSTAIGLTTGHRFQIDTTAAKSDWVIDRIQHQAEDRAHRPTQTDPKQNTQHYHNQFHCFPASRPLSPPPRARPKMPGCQTATVIGHSQATLDTEKLARVKIQFHWQTTADHRPARWVRVKQMLAGNQWGSLFLPRIGSEVLVDFVNGDVDRPIIVGQAYNAMQKPPYPTTQIHQAGIKTRSFEPTHQSYNAIEFNDQADAQTLTIHAANSLQMSVENDHQLQVGGSYTQTIQQADSLEETKGHYQLSSQKGIQLCCGDSFIHLDDKGITLNGALIHINS